MDTKQKKPLTGEPSYTVGPITLGKVRAYKAAGLDDPGEQFLSNFNKLLDNPKDLVAFCEKIFTDDFSHVEADDILVNEVLKGVLFLGHAGLGLKRILELPGAES